MDSHANPQASANRGSISSVARYRVMARQRNRRQSLVTLAESLRQAATLAEAFRDAVAARRDGIVAVRVEEWVGTLTEGEWRSVSPWKSGFSHRFATQLARRGARNGDQPISSLPRTGDKVECVLLSEKTRKGGWKAKLLQRGTEEPITNNEDVPKSAKPGQTVTLQVGSISHDGQRIQFRWQQADNTERQ